jgi:hypothetical protein
LGKEAPVQDKLSPLEVFVSCFSISSLAGLAALLRGGKPLTWRSVAATTLYSGIFGLVIGLLWYNYFGGDNNVYFLIGVSGLAGLGGTSLLEFVVQGISNGFNIKITTDNDEPPESK